MNKKDMKHMRMRNLSVRHTSWWLLLVVHENMILIKKPFEIPASCERLEKLHALKKQ